MARIERMELMIPDLAPTLRPADAIRSFVPQVP
jgi:hypothetical protein